MFATEVNSTVLVSGRSRETAVRHIALRLASLILFFVGWEQVAQNMKSMLFPSFSETVSALVELLASPAFWGALWVSNQALLIGFLAAAVFGILLGLLMGRWNPAERVAAPYLSVLLVLPVSALIPLLIIATGLGLVTRVLVVFTFAFVIIAVTSRAGIRTLDASLTEMAISFNASERQIWRHILLPGTLPILLTALRLGLGRALSGMVAAELLVVAVGVGRLILEFQGNFDTAHVFATVLVVVAQAVTLNEGLKYVERRLCPWRVGLEDR